MKKNKNVNFFQQKNIIISHIKMNWKLILFFIVFWFIISIICLSLTLINPSGFLSTNLNAVYVQNINIKLPIIAPGMLGTKDSLTIGIYSISDFLNFILFSFPEILFFALITIVFINKIFINEINSRRILFWITSPLSRNQIFIGKYLFIVFINFMVFIPSYILIIMFSSFSPEANEYIGKIILYGFELFLFNILMISFFFLLSVLITNNLIVLNIIYSLILFWIFISGIAIFLYNQDSTGESS